ncbi:unnamed protein product [Thelazia callipaeda]|uniref:Ovule protein n=1 Tax=Thelazia callipaeda TaxID=103827 RepID=A0A0N5CPA2_THECL|nr:unnamed protein product [Thelazia callipaeda]
MLFLTKRKNDAVFGMFVEQEQKESHTVCFLDCFFCEHLQNEGTKRSSRVLADFRLPAPPLSSYDEFGPPLCDFKVDEEEQRLRGLKVEIGTIP